MEGGEEGGVAAGERGGRSRWSAGGGDDAGWPAEMAWTRDGRATMRDGDDGQRSTRRRRAAQGRGRRRRGVATRGGSRRGRGEGAPEKKSAVISGDSPLKTASMDL